MYSTKTAAKRCGLEINSHPWRLQAGHKCACLREEGHAANGRPACVCLCGASVLKEAAQ